MQGEIDAFLKSLWEEKGYSNNTVVAYQNDLYQFMRFLADRTNVTSCEMVSTDCLVDYVNALKNEHQYASATVARKVAATKSFFRHLVSRGILKEDPSATLDSPKVHKYLPTSISEEEVKCLLRAPLSHDTSRSKRDSALLEILYATGMRVSEVVALDVQDVQLENSSVHCVNKTGKSRERTIPIYARAVEALQRYLEKSRPQLLQDNEETALFLNHRGHRLTRQGLWLIIKKYVQESGIDASVTPHTLRHSFATHLLNGGADVHEVQGLLGHANVSTTQVYAQMSQEKLREAYDEAHPRAH